MRMCACRGTAGFAHVSCLVEQAKILFAEAEENNLGPEALQARWDRWDRCSLCEQHYHRAVACALGWACWKTYVERPETDQFRGMAMNVLGLGLSGADHHEDALSVQEAELSMRRRLGAPATIILAAQNNLATSYGCVGRLEDATRMQRDVYSGRLNLLGEEDERTLIAANNYAAALVSLEHYEEAKALLRRTTPVARRVLGEGDRLTLKMRCVYAGALCQDPSATLDDISEAVTTLKEIERTARRVMGRAHPLTTAIEHDLRDARAALRAREAEAVRVAECDALQRDLDATQARIAALDASKAEVIGKLTPPGDAYG